MIESLHRQWNKIFKKSRAYKKIFTADTGDLNEDAKIVLADLKKFCRADSSTVMGNGKIDPMAMAILEGRREVWMRINHYLHLDEAVTINLSEVTNE